MIEVTLLSILQGIAEFLPISSSGHLVLGKSLLGMKEMGMRIDIFLHVGTLIAIFAFYFAIIRRIILNLEWSYMLKVVLSAIPAGIVGVLFKDQLEEAFASTKMVGAALVFTGLVLTATRFLPKGDRDVSFGRALWMGIAQAIAILPGVSRSGMTLAAARASKVEAAKSAEFSFLMSAPPIAGAALLELLKSLKEPGATEAAEVSWGLTIYGCVLAAVVGYFSLKLLLKSLKGRWFWLFGPYCILAGLVAFFATSASASAAEPAVAASDAAAGPVFMNILPTALGHEEQTAEDAKEYVRRTGNRIVLYSLSFHPEGFPAKEKADRLVASYRRLHKLLEGSDVQLGVLIQSVIGHWPRVDEKIEPWTRTVTLSGGVSRFCPLDPNFRAYIRDFVKGLAAEHPSFVMGDDDIHLYDECFCDLHRAEFNRRAGLNCTAEEFRKLVGESKPGEKAFDTFFKLQRETMTGLCSFIREAIDEVDPKVPAGMCMSWIEYRFIGDLAKAIAAKGQRPLLRIANDAGYAEFDRDTFCDLVLRTAAYESVYGRDCTLLDESDVFPHNLWNKSAANLKAKLAFSYAEGIDGGLLWLTCAHRSGFKVADNYAKAIEENGARFRALKAFADESEALGFTVPVQTRFPDWRFDGKGIDPFVSGLNWGGNVAAMFGVPFRCSTSLGDGGIYAIAGERTVERFSDAELKRLLAGRLLLDGDAVRAIAKRGFAKHLGLAVEDRKLNYVCERSTDGKRTYPLRLVAAHPVPTLAAADGAEVLTWLEFESYAGAPDHKRLAPATVYFENELGGKVLSAAYTLETGSNWSLQRFFRYCEPRKAWFVRVLDRLAPQPFVVDEMRDIVALARERADGSKLLFVINTNRDPLETLHVRVKCDFSTVEELGADGAFHPVKFTREGDVLVFARPLACYEFTALRFR